MPYRAMGDLGHRRIHGIQFADDGFGCFCSYGWFGIVVVVFDGSFDGGLKVEDGMKDAAIQALTGSMWRKSFRRH
ncbi:MAG: hypothetical protein ACR2QF_06025 [Geminicoccaceae bacterium]